ncbi:MAG: hypothetical protein ACXWJ0_12470, partial [Xanthobacteraceae bacterium]
VGLRMISGSVEGEMRERADLRLAQFDRLPAEIDSASRRQLAIFNPPRNVECGQHDLIPPMRRDVI